MLLGRSAASRKALERRLDLFNLRKNVMKAKMIRGVQVKPSSVLPSVNYCDISSRFVELGKKSVCLMEVDEDFVPDKFHDGLWEEAMGVLIAQWVSDNAYSGTGTIYRWSSMSSNFHHLGMSTFYAVLGMPVAFRKYLSSELECLLKKSYRAYSDEVIPKISGGWNAAIQIEQGKAWKDQDGQSWTCIKRTQN